ncbi:MAG: molybdopterin dinucleotide binding domain-containing protein, partial [Acidobacteriota bacterium]
PANVPHLILRDGYPPGAPGTATRSGRRSCPPSRTATPTPSCLITYWANPVYTIPAGTAQEAILKDRSALPLFVAIDININETTRFADYILPDGSYLERWGTPGAAPAVVTKVSAWRQPVVGTYDKGTPAERDASAPFDVDAANDYTPYHPTTKTLEDIYIAIGKRLGLPGVGANAFVDGGSLDRAWDFYKKVLANLTADANANGFSVTPEDVVARGGVFQSPEDAYDWGTGFLLNRQNGRNNVYSESWATYLNARTVTAWDPLTGKPLDGEYFDPLPVVETRSFDSLGRPLTPDPLPLLLTTYKTVLHTQSRTIVCPSLQMHLPESLIEMNASDAAARGLQDGDLARVFSVDKPEGVVGRVRLTETLRPGVVAIVNSLGHWAMQSAPFEVDGQPADYDPGRALGVHGNPIMKVDPVLGDMPLTDPLGMGAVYFETRVDVVKL